ncbi:MAG: chromate transporter [Lachnospiraceae bacterium]|nr:chromate transporter [Lachnospiraceae bacterium]
MSDRSDSKKKLLTLFTSVFKISACTFGGGFVIIPLMKKRFVEELGWIEDQEMLDLIAIAQSSPGPVAVNASILIGYHTAGPGGALLTVLGTVMPPLIIISVISLFYKAFRDNIFVSMAMAGMLCGVAAVILDVVINMAVSVFRQKRLLPVLVMAGSFVVVRYLGVNIILVILACALIGAADTGFRDRKIRRQES